MLKIKNLSISYKDASNNIILNATYSFEKGKIYGILGPNGIGKSSLINCLIDKNKNYNGDILYNNKNIKDNILYKQELGFVSDLPTLYENVIGKKYLFRISKIYGIKDKEIINNKINYYSNIFNIDKYLDLKIKSYSLGTKQKINFISSLLHEPRILILDEPMTGLDDKSTKIFIDLLKSIKSNDKTIILSSHLLNIVENLCDEVLIIKDKELQNIKNKNLKKEYLKNIKRKKYEK